MVTACNNNKYYKMIPKSGDRWVAEYGRVGTSPQRREYGMSCWESKYREKIKKGYVDQSDLVEDLIKTEMPEHDGYRAIENQAIAEIVQRLQNMARKAISENYTISANKVTWVMVDEAQDILTQLLTITDVKQFNDTLLKLFMTIPRSMVTVNLYLAKSDSDFPRIIKREQDLLDIMSGQVIQQQKVDDSPDVAEKDYTILEQLGLIFEECTENDIIKIKSALGSCADKFHKAWRVTNRKTQEKFDNFVQNAEYKEVKSLFHGSRNENWWSIINTGLVLRPTNAVITGKMFGYGIYYAPKARKSLGYTSLKGSYWASGDQDIGFMALMKVAYGKPFHVYDYDYKYQSFNKQALQRVCPGSGCLHAHEGRMLRNDEIIIYDEAQCTIEYLIELRN